MRLREARDVPSFNAALRDVYLSVFEPQMVYFYHFFDGCLNVPFEACYGLVPTKAELEAFLEVTRIYDPLDVKRRGRLMHHSSELYRWYQDRPEMIQQSYVSTLAEWGCDWMLSVHFFEGDVFLGCAGMAQSWEAGDFTDHDLEALEILFPFLEESFRECCRNSRHQMFGNAMAQAIEYHPSGLFLFHDDTIFYSNLAGRALLQNENDQESRFPMTQRSMTFKAIRAWMQGCEISVPGIQSLESIELEGWPSLGMNRVRLVMANRRPTTATRLTEWERKVLRTVAEYETQPSADKLGISIHTLRTHLRNIYRKLGVSSLNEAVASVYLAG